MTTDLSVLRRIVGKAAHGCKSMRGRKLGRSRARLLEGLESRVLFATDYVLSGNTLTTYTNGVAGAPVVVPDVNNVQITGDNTLNHIIIEAFAGRVTVNGGGGGDQITVNGGGGGIVTLAGTTTSDHLVVRAPIAVLANVTVGATTINVGSDTVNYNNNLAAISVVGQLFTNGDTLTVGGTSGNEAIEVTGSTIKVGARPVIYYSTFTQLTVNGGGGDDVFTLSGNQYPTHLLSGGAGNVTFNVNTNSVATTITGSTSGTSTFNINSNAGGLTVNGQGAANTFNVSSSAAGLVLNGGTTTNAYSVTSNSANLTINGGGTSNNVDVVANSGAITVNGGTGTDSFVVGTNSGSVTLRGGAGATTSYEISAPTIGPVSVQGNAVGTGALTFRGTTLTNVFAVTATTLSAGTGATVTYSNLTSVTVDGVAGNDTFLVTSSGTPTTLLGRTGNNVFNVRANTALTTIDAGTGTNTINVGSNAPSTLSNVLGNVAGGVDVIGSGSDVLNLDDAGNAVSTTARLSTTGFTGIGGGVTYSGLATLNVRMGSGGNTLNVTGTMTTTGVNLGSGVNSVMISSSAPATGGDVESVFGMLTLTGSGADDLVVDDTGSVGAKTGIMTGGWIGGITPATVIYSGFASMVVGLGTGGTDFTVLATNATTPLTVNGGAGDDTIRIHANSSATAVTTGGGADVVAVRWIGAATTVTSAGGSTVVVGSNAPGAGGVLANIQALLTVNGAGTDVLVLDDTGNAAGASGVVTATGVTGFGMGVDGIAYANLGALNLNLGTGANALTVADTAAVTVTTVTGNTGVDTVTVQQAGGVTNLNLAGGADVVQVIAVSATTSVDLGAGTGDVVRVSSTLADATGVADGVVATLNVTAGGTASMVVGDGGNVSPKTVTMAGGSVSGVSAGTINYTNLTAVTLLLGSAGDAVDVTGTSTVTTIDTGAGDDTVEVRATAAADVTVLTGAGDNFVVAGSNGAVGNGVTGGIVGKLTVTGGGTTEFAIDDWGNGTGTTAEMTASSVTGLNPGGFAFSGVTKLVVSLGGADDTFVVRDTIAGETRLNTNAGADTVDVYKTSGDTTVDNDNGADVVNVGDPDVVAGKHVMDGVVGALHLTVGSGTYTLNLLDTGATANKTAAVSGGTATGFSAGAIDFAGVTTLNVALGGGAYNVTLTSPAASVGTNLTTGTASSIIAVRSVTSATTLNLGVAGNTVNVGSDAVAFNSTLDLINAPLTIHGGGFDQVNLYDNGNAVAKSVAINVGDVTGASPAPIAFDNLNTLRLTLGSGNDDVVINDSSAYLTVNMGPGDDTANVRKTTRDITVQDASGSNTVRVGSLAPSLGGTLNDIAGGVAVSGNVSSTLVVDDSGNSVGKAGNLTANRLTGLSVGEIFYGVGTLDVRLGTGNDTLNVSATAAFNNTLVSTGAGVDTVNVASASGVTPVAKPLTVTGSGNDTLNVSDAGAAGARVGTLTASVLSLANASVTYGGLSNLNVTLLAQTALAVASTAGATSTAVTATGGSVTVGGSAKVTAGIAGPLSVAGGFATDVIVDDSNDATARTVTVTSTAVSGLSPAVITYSAAKSLTVRAGSGADTVTVNGTHGQGTTVETGGGADGVNVRGTTGVFSVAAGAGANVVTVGSVAGTFGGIGNAVTVSSGGEGSLTLDADGEGASQNVVVGKSTVTGLNNGGVTYGGFASLTVNLGNAGADVDVVGTTSATSVNLGSGNDRVDVTSGGLDGTLTLNGADGADALSVDDTGSSAGGAVTLTPTTIDGLGARVTYASFATLSLSLGANRTLVVNDINGATATTVSVPSGQGQVNFAGTFVGQLVLSNFSGGTVSVGGDLAGALNVGGGLQALTVGGALTGSVTVGAGLGTLGVGGNLAGSVAVTGGVGTITVGGDLAATGSIGVGAKLGRLAIGGRDAGNVTVAAVDVITVGAATPAEGTGTLFSVTESGVFRQIRAIASHVVAAPGVTARVVYDSSLDGVPQAAIEINNASPGNRFDVILEAPASSSGFDLTRLKGSGDRIVGVRNVNVAGGLLNDGITAAQAQYFGEPEDGVGGVYLPADKLAAVSVSGNMALWSVRAQSIQAVAFSTVTQKNGQVWSAGNVSGEKKWQQEILTGTLAVNPKTRQPFAKIVRPTEQLRVMAGTNARRPAALFIGKDKAKVFVGRPAYFTDQRIDDGEPPVAAEVTYAGKWSPVYPVITQLTFRGTGGSVDTIHVVQRITSTGPLGDVTLRGGKEQKLESLNAPQGMFGKLALPDGGEATKAAKKGLAKAKAIKVRR